MAVVASWGGAGILDGTVLGDGSSGFGDTPWTSVTSNGNPFTVSLSGLHGPRIQVDQAGGEAAQLVWDQSVIGTLSTHAVRLYMELTEYPGGNARFLNCYDNLNGLNWFLDIQPTGILRFKDGSGVTQDSTTDPIPLNTVVRIEVKADGTGGATLDYYLGDSTIPLETLTVTGLGTTVQQFRFGNPNASPTWPRYFLDEIVITDTDALIGPATAPESSLGFRDLSMALHDDPVSAIEVRVPPSVRSGDQMLAAMVTAAGAPLTAPAGWTQLGTTLNEGNTRAALWHRVAGTQEPASYVFSTGGLGTAAAFIGLWSGGEGIDDALASTLVDTTLLETGEVSVPEGGWLVTIAADRRESAAVPQSWTISDGSDIRRGQVSGSDGTGSQFSLAVFDSDRALVAGDYHREVSSSQTWAQALVWTIAMLPDSGTADDTARLAGRGGTLLGEADIQTTVEVSLSGQGTLVIDDVLVSVDAGPVTMGGTGGLVIDDVLVTIPAGQVDLAGTGSLVIDDANVLIIAEVTMGGVGGLDVRLRYPETLLVNGIDIYECIQFMTPDVDGLISPPAKKTGNVDVPMRHGAVRTPHKRYDVATMPLTVWVKGTNPDGSIPRRRRDAFYANLNTILRAFTGQVELEHITPDGTSRVISGEVLDKIDFTRYVWGATGRVGVVITATYPFWQDKEPTTVSLFAEGEHVLEEFAAATAPVERLLITFEGPSSNPRLECGDYFVQYNDTLIEGEQLTIDTENWSLSSPNFTPDYAALVHAGIGHWFTLEPREGGPVVVYSQTGSGPGAVTLTGRLAYLEG